LAIIRYSKKKRRTEEHVSETGCFHPQVRGQETLTQLDPSERATLNH
jgi:hypothetical protein